MPSIDQVLCYMPFVGSLIYESEDSERHHAISLIDVFELSRGVYASRFLLGIRMLS